MIIAGFKTSSIRLRTFVTTVCGFSGNAQQPALSSEDDELGDKEQTNEANEVQGPLQFVKFVVAKIS